MNTARVTHITSRDNPLVRELRRLAQDNTAYRKSGQVWLEGDHLCRAVLGRGLQPAMVVFSASFWEKPLSEWEGVVTKIVVLDDTIFSSISGLESPASMGFVLGLPSAHRSIQAGVSTVVLDRVQDAGNVGSILRSAAAFGCRQVLAIKGTAALWSPKVVRAGMGAHFALDLHETLSYSDLDALQLPLVMTSSHQGVDLPVTVLPQPCAWVMGHEGQGVGEALARKAHLAVRIPQPGGEESLNVAAAAAICLYTSACQPRG